MKMPLTEKSQAREKDEEEKTSVHPANGGPTYIKYLPLLYVCKYASPLSFWFSLFVLLYIYLAIYPLYRCPGLLFICFVLFFFILGEGIGGDIDHFQYILYHSTPLQSRTVTLPLPFGFFHPRYLAALLPLFPKGRGPESHRQKNK